jgi:hypothetical protein
MKKKKETRGRKSKMHEPIGASFYKVIEVVGDSKYKDEKTIKKKLKAKKKIL